VLGDQKKSAPAEDFHQTLAPHLIPSQWGMGVLAGHHLDSSPGVAFVVPCVFTFILLALLVYLIVVSTPSVSSTELLRLSFSLIYFSIDYLIDSVLTSRVRFQ
jgi:hypothetical protein